MKERFFMKYINIINLILFLFQIMPFIEYDCDYDHPIKKNEGTCQESIENLCTESDFESNICKIENEIVETQWLSSIIKYGKAGSDYATLATTPDGNLICTSSHYTNTAKYYYGLDKDGRPLFHGNSEDTPFAETNSDQPRNEGSIFGIKLDLASNDEGEYIIALANNNANFELYDFNDNNKVYKIDGKTFLGTFKNTFQYVSIFKYKTEENCYIISFIAEDSNSKAQFFLNKYIFHDKDISSSSSYTKSNILVNSASAHISSCFEINNNIILCFCLDFYKNYLISAYNDNLEQLAVISINSTYYAKTNFYKSVHFTGDAGAFLYDHTEEIIAIQFKEYTSGNIKKFFSFK